MDLTVFFRGAAVEIGPAIVQRWQESDPRREQHALIQAVGDERARRWAAYWRRQRSAAFREAAGIASRPRSSRGCCSSPGEGQAAKRDTRWTSFTWTEGRGLRPATAKRSSVTTTVGCSAVPSAYHWSPDPRWRVVS